jgi:N-acetylglucosaminyl-diphospho-decaprenol L-rhamnosyltransferase
VDVEISFCVVNTNGRELLMRCLDAVAAARASLRGAASEVLVLDNASDDGSVGGRAAHGAEEIELIALDERREARRATTAS